MFLCSLGQWLEQSLPCGVESTTSQSVTAVSNSETVMMLGSNDDVLHPSFFGHANPGVWIVIRRVELLGVC